MSIYTTLKNLSGYTAAAGGESALTDAIKNELSGLGLQFHTDALGNLTAEKDSFGECGIMVSCHSDSIGFIVTCAEESGLIRVASAGIKELGRLAYSRVVSDKGIKGIFVPVSDKSGELKITDVAIDIGAKNKAEALKKAPVGTRFSVTDAPIRLSGSRVSMPSLDNKLGCACLIEIARSLAQEELPGKLCFTFTVQHEVGRRGAGRAAERFSPDMAIDIDCSASENISVSKGPAIKLKDKSILSSPAVCELLKNAAKQENITYQLEVNSEEFSDAEAIAESGSGVPSAAVTIPLKYIHSPVETADLNDAEGLVKLVCAALRKAKL